MLDFLGSIWWLAVTLGVLVTFHEFGHFWVARRCGVKVLRFSVGFGRALWSRTARDGTEYRIEPGTVYALDQHDEHVLLAETELRLVCVFNPPLVGPEVHDDTRGYPLLEVAEATPTP